MANMKVETKNKDRVDRKVKQALIRALMDNGDHTDAALPADQ